LTSSRYFLLLLRELIDTGVDSVSFGSF
jgi:hypothetical protein